jgi:hypothetical protein
MKTFDSNDDYVVQFDTTLSHVKTVQLVSWSIPWSFPNVDSSTNTIVFVEGGITKTATIAPGNYSLFELGAAIGVAMTSASGGVNVFTVSSSTIFVKFKINSSATAFTVKAASTSARRLIGIGEADETAIAAAVGFELVCSEDFSLLPTTELQIHLPGVVRNVRQRSALNINAIIEVISLAGYRFGEYLKNDSEGTVYESSAASLSQLIVSITDQTGFTPNFSSKTPITMRFLIEYDAPRNEL